MCQTILPSNLHRGCRKDAGWGFTRPRQPSHWFCFEHRGAGERYLQRGHIMTRATIATDLEVARPDCRDL
ncbi:MAG: hypothetical protein E5X00_01870, partial [Mesorhizobium sp.]